MSENEITVGKYQVISDKFDFDGSIGLLRQKCVEVGDTFYVDEVRRMGKYGYYDDSCVLTRDELAYVRKIEETVDNHSEDTVLSVLQEIRDLLEERW